MRVGVSMPIADSRCWTPDIAPIHTTLAHIIIVVVGIRVVTHEVRVESSSREDGLEKQNRRQNSHFSKESLKRGSVKRENVPAGYFVA